MHPLPTKLVQAFLSCIVLLTAINVARSHTTRSDILVCLDARNVPYATTDSTNWTRLWTPFNLRLQYELLVITIPETEDQVSSSVACAAAAGIKVQPKGGGHPYASYSTGGLNGSLNIELENFSEITVNQSRCFRTF